MEMETEMGLDTMPVDAMSHAELFVEIRKRYSRGNIKPSWLGMCVELARKHDPLIHTVK